MWVGHACPRELTPPNILGRPAMPGLARTQTSCHPERSRTTPAPQTRHHILRELSPRPQRALHRKSKINLYFASNLCYPKPVAANAQTQHRSWCPVNVCLEVFGDRWSLLIVRDLMVRGYKTFKQFQESGEGIATNMLADRLKKLESSGILEHETEPNDGRKVNYRLTQK